MDQNIHPEFDQASEQGRAEILDQQQKKDLKRVARMNIIWILLALMALGGATYAWFSFNSITNVEPNTGSTVSGGNESLLIANTANGDFSTECKLLPQSNGGNLRPMSTANLTNYYSAIGQDSNGISIMYEESTRNIDSWTVHGYLYLKVDGGTKPMDVYLMQQKLNFGSNVQALASMRLGIKPANAGATILKLDDMANTSGAAQKQTTPSQNTVVQSISNGAANYVPDTSQNISTYAANASGADDKTPRAGNSKLCTVRNGETVRVEYVLYLEGCDINTINDVQNKDVKLQLSFAGVPAGN